MFTKYQTGLFYDQVQPAYEMNPRIVFKFGLYTNRAEFEPILFPTGDRTLCGHLDSFTALSQAAPRLYFVKGKKQATSGKILHIQKII